MLPPLLRLFLVVLLTAVAYPANASSCGGKGMGVQVLGSGGTQIGDNRASSGFLVWANGRARIMVNVGGGSALRFAQSGAQVSDLKAILISNVQADSTAALPALVQMSINKHRDSALQLYGPGGYKTVPSTVALIRALFEVSGGAYRELGKVLSPLDNGGFKLRPKNIDIRFKDGIPLFNKGLATTTPFKQQGLKLSAAPVDRAGIPALAWRVDINSKSVIFAGKTMGKTSHLLNLARGASTLVIAVPMNKGDSMSIESIARLAQDSGVDQLVLTNLTNSDNLEQTIRRRISSIYKGKILFAEDLKCYQL